MVYAEDHPAHVDVLKAFSKFLYDHCKCDVKFAPWCVSEVNQDKLRWIMRSFENADYVIVVNSLSAYHQFKAGKRLRSPHDSPLADLFYPAINQIHHRVCLNSDYGKLINVCFEYTKSEHFIEEICAGAQYRLLKHLQELLCHIHHINQQTTKMKDVGLAFVEDISVLPEGQKVVDAIKEAVKYEKSNPRWFEMDFYDSGVECAENITAEDRKIIKSEYERNLQSMRDDMPTEDSISKIIENQERGIWNIPVENSVADIEPSMAYTYTGESLDIADDITRSFNVAADDNTRSFMEPSLIDDYPDIRSDCLSDQMQEINKKYFDDSPQQIVYFRNTPQENDGECISLGGVSVWGHVIFTGINVLMCYVIQWWFVNPGSDSPKSRYPGKKCGNRFPRPN